MVKTYRQFPVLVSLTYRMEAVSKNNKGFSSPVSCGKSWAEEETARNHVVYTKGCTFSWHAAPGVAGRSLCCTGRIRAEWAKICTHFSMSGKVLRATPAQIKGCWAFFYICKYIYIWRGIHSWGWLTSRPGRAKILTACFSCKRWYQGMLLVELTAQWWTSKDRASTLRLFRRRLGFVLLADALGASQQLCSLRCERCCWLVQCEVRPWSRTRALTRCPAAPRWSRAATCVCLLWGKSWPSAQSCKLSCVYHTWLFMLTGSLYSFYFVLG